jgi:GrpB-like predicted nucleotidyltransferase (UPF0157 family)
VDEDTLRATVIGELKRLDGQIVLVDYDPDWPRQFTHAADRIRAALGDRVLLLEHVGSTSVPGLAAKPLIDIVLGVEDSTDEPSYVPPLEAAGYTLRIREPDWWQHRMLAGDDPRQNLHVFGVGCPESDRMLRFRDWLRSHDDDRRRYEDTKRSLASRTWAYTQNYADAKSEVVETILERAGEIPIGSAGA